MEKEIIEEIVKELIKEEEYQKVKRKLNKKDDYFSRGELQNFNAIFNATPKKNYKKRSETK